MKVNLNKTVLAMALAGFGGMAQAAVVAQVPTDYSKQYVESVAAATVVTTGFTVTLNAEYKNDDVVTIKFTSPLAAGYVAPNSVVGANGANSVVTLGLLSQTADTVTYRVTDIQTQGNGSTVGNVLTFANVQFTAGVLNSVADIKATYAAKTATGNFDLDVATTNTAKVLAAANQFKLVVTTPKSGTIGLPARTSFSAADVALVTTMTDTVALREFVTLGTITYTLEGDFSWIKDTNAAAGLTPAVGVVAITNATYDAAQSSASKLVYTHTAATAETVTFDLGPNTAAAGVPAAAATAATVAQVLKKTDFTITASITYTGSAAGTYVAASKVNAGRWLVDGVNVDIPYLVRGQIGGAGKYFGHVVNATNNHSTTGNITVDLFQEDGTVIVRGASAGSIKPRETRTLSGDINTALGGYQGRFNATVFIEVPAGQAQVYSAYTDPDTKERAIVINSSN